VQSGSRGRYPAQIVLERAITTLMTERNTAADNFDMMVQTWRDAEDELAALTERATRAETDTARLDWLDEHSAAITVEDNECGTLNVQSNLDYTLCGRAETIRAAIDAARVALPSDSTVTEEGTA
jgi:uncharacterized protein YfcZ (UPF0381/DUF406 family)